ncbi:MAG: IS1182 family transposase [Bacteroidota bacterium]
MPKKQGQDTTQFGLFATPLEAMIASDNEVRVIAAFVDGLDLDELGFVQVHSQGRSRYSSDVLLKIYLYGYLNGIRSSRKLEKACRVNIELMWLTGNLQPAYHTIADFRKDHPDALKQVFRTFTLLLKDWALLGLDTIAIDGTKIRGQNAMKRNFNKKKIKRQLDRIDAQIEEAIQEWEQADEQTQQEKRPAIDELLRKLDDRRKGYERLEETLDESGETQVSLTDPDTRALPLHRNIVEVGFNVQQAVDDKHNLIVRQEVTNQGDINALGDLAVDTCNELSLSLDDEVTVLADKGYHNAAELDYCQQNNIETLVAERKQSSGKKEVGFRKEDFVYQPDEDVYICPAGEKLTTNGQLYKKPSGSRRGHTAYRFHRYTTSSTICHACALKDKCLSTSALQQRHARGIERNEFAEALDRNKERLQARPELYKRRQAIVEHPFGTIKRSWGYTYTLLKGLEKVGGEWSLIATCYNLRRSMSIVGVPLLLEWLNSGKSIKNRLKSMILMLWSWVEREMSYQYQEPLCRLVWRRQKVVNLVGVQG